VESGMLIIRQGMHYWTPEIRDKPHKNKNGGCEYWSYPFLGDIACFFLSISAVYASVKVVEAEVGEINI